jgi:hypothetical protein
VFSFDDEADDEVDDADEGDEEVGEFNWLFTSKLDIVDVEGDVDEPNDDTSVSMGTFELFADDVAVLLIRLSFLLFANKLRLWPLFAPDEFGSSEFLKPFVL